MRDRPHPRARRGHAGLRGHRGALRRLQGGVHRRPALDRARARPPPADLRRPAEPAPRPRRAVRLLPPARQVHARAAARREVGLHARREARRRRPRGRHARHGPRGRLHAPHHGAVRAQGPLHREGRRPGGRLHGRAGRGDARRRGRLRDQGADDAALAGQGPDLVLRRAPPPGEDDGHADPHDRHVLPRRARRHLLHPRAVRRREDGPAADDLALRAGRHRDLRRVRRARGRGGRDAARVPGAPGPAHRQDADGR